MKSILDGAMVFAILLACLFIQFAAKHLETKQFQ